VLYHLIACILEEKIVETEASKETEENKVNSIPSEREKAINVEFDEASDDTKTDLSFSPMGVLSKTSVASLQSIEGFAIALYDFAGDDGNQLTFKQGQIIAIEKKDGSDWWLGSLDGKPGFFPSSYVQEVNADTDMVKSRSFSNASTSNDCFTEPPKRKPPPRPLRRETMSVPYY